MDAALNYSPYFMAYFVLYIIVYTLIFLPIPVAVVFEGFRE